MTIVIRRTGCQAILFPGAGRNRMRRLFQVWTWNICYFNQLFHLCPICSWFKSWGNKTTDCTVEHFPLQRNSQLDKHTKHSERFITVPIKHTSPRFYKLRLWNVDLGLEWLGAMYLHITWNLQPQFQIFWFRVQVMHSSKPLQIPS